MRPPYYTSKQAGGVTLKWVWPWSHKVTIGNKKSQKVTVFGQRFCEGFWREIRSQKGMCRDGVPPAFGEQAEPARINRQI